jgi:hypothetical protein
MSQLPNDATQLVWRLAEEAQHLQGNNSSTPKENL